MSATKENLKNINQNRFAPSFVNYKKGCTQLTAARDKVYQLLAHGRWFSPGSSTTKTGRHDIAEILLKVALTTKNQNQPKEGNTFCLTYKKFPRVLLISHAIKGIMYSAPSVYRPPFYRQNSRLSLFTKFGQSNVRGVAKQCFN